MNVNEDKSTSLNISQIDFSEVDCLVLACIDILIRGFRNEMPRFQSENLIEFGGLYRRIS